MSLIYSKYAFLAVEKKEKRKCSERGKDLEEGKERRTVMTTFIDYANSQSHLLEVCLFGSWKKREAQVF